MALLNMITGVLYWETDIFLLLTHSMYCLSLLTAICCYIVSMVTVGCLHTVTSQEHFKLVTYGVDQKTFKLDSCQPLSQLSM